MPKAKAKVSATATQAAQAQGTNGASHTDETPDTALVIDMTLIDQLYPLHLQPHIHALLETKARGWKRCEKAVKAGIKHFLLEGRYARLRDYHTEHFNKTLDRLEGYFTQGTLKPSQKGVASFLRTLPQEVVMNIAISKGIQGEVAGALSFDALLAFIINADGAAQQEGDAVGTTAEATQGNTQLIRTTGAE